MREFGAKHLNRAADRGERIPNFMRDARRQLSNGREAIRPHNLLLHGFHFRQILKNANHARRLRLLI